MPFEGSTKVACFCAIRSLLLDAETSEISVPSNQGSFRPIEVIAPKGSIFNPKFPAAAEARFSQINRVIDLIYKALAPVLPNDIIAGSSATLSFAAYSGVKPDGEYWVFLEVNEGSYGGRPASDGPDSIDNLMANTRNNPLEDLAIHLPMICDRYELRDDVMPGAGRYRWRHRRGQEAAGCSPAASSPTSAIATPTCPGGSSAAPPGNAAPSRSTTPRRPDDIRDMPAKFAGLRVTEGDVMAVYAPCGGGYGDPLERPAEQVLEDVLDDFCTLEHAKRAYGVVVDLDTESVDLRATEALRSRMRADPRRTADPFARHRLGRTPAGRRARLPPRRKRPRLRAKSPAGAPSVEDLVARLNARLGDDWSFDVAAPSPERRRDRGGRRARGQRHPGATHRRVERQRTPPPGSAARYRIGGGVPILRGGDCWGRRAGAPG